MCIYADDITLFLNSLDSLQHVLNTFDLFSKYSSLNINVNKSEISWIGKWKNKADNPNNLNLIDLNKETIKILDIHALFI